MPVSAADVIASAKAVAAGATSSHPVGLAALAAVDWTADLQVLLSTYVQYWHHTVGACAFWLGLHFLFALIFSRTTIVAQIVKHLTDGDVSKGRKPRSEKKYLYRARFDLYSKATAFVHAIVASGFAIYVFANFRPIEDLNVFAAYTRDPVLHFAAQLSAGYFLYDFLIAVYDVDPAYILHGFCSAVIYAHSAFPFCAQIGVIFLIYEVSTVFVHLRWFLISTGRGATKLFAAAQGAFVICFLLVRIAFGLTYSLFYLQPFLWSLFLAIPVTPHCHIAPALLAVSNLSLNGLNLMWTKMIIDALRRATSGKGEKGDKKKVGSTAAPAVTKKAE
jgi:hypothetical protein